MVRTHDRKSFAVPQSNPGRQYVYFEDVGENGSELDRANVTDRKRERILGFKDIPPVYVLESNNPWSGLDLNDSPLVLRDVRIQEIYALDLEFP